jgi:hypothetical protein
MSILNTRTSVRATILFVLSSFLALQILHSKAADVSVYALYKRKVFVQLSDSPPVLRCCPYMFDAVVELSDSNSVSSATLGHNANQAISLSAGYIEEFLPSRPITWISEGFPDQAALDAKWPAGDYTFSIFAAKDGAQTAILPLTGDHYPTNPPHILNFKETQQVDANRDFILRWKGLENGTTNDFTFVLIKRASDGVPVSNTPFLAENNALDGTVSAILIPAGTLAPGEQYDVYVRFDRVLRRDAASYPGAVGQASYGSGTHFTLKTVGS